MRATWSTWLRGTVLNALRYQWTTQRYQRAFG